MSYFGLASLTYVAILPPPPPHSHVSVLFFVFPEHSYGSLFHTALVLFAALNSKSVLPLFSPSLPPPTPPSLPPFFRQPGLPAFRRLSFRGLGFADLSFLLRV